MSLYALVRLERAIMSCLAPLTGERATGAVTLSATGADVAISKETPPYAIPIIGSAAGVDGLDYDRMVKLVQTATITAAGVNVTAVSMLGGLRQNLPAGTVVRLNPPIAGLQPTGVIAAPGLTGGAAPGADELGTLARVVAFEGIGQTTAADAVFKAGAGLFPSAVVSWEGWDIGELVGKDRQKHRCQFRIYVVCSRLDGHNPRRDEGKLIIEAIAEEFVSKQAVDGEAFSLPPVTLGRAQRWGFAPTSYVWSIDLFATHTVVRRERRPPFAEWLKTRLDATHDEAPVVTEYMISMRSGEFDEGFDASFDIDEQGQSQ